MPKHEGHGFGAYWLPYLSFMLVGEVAGRAPEEWSPYFLPLKIAFPLGFLFFYFGRGQLQELRGYRPGIGAIGLDFLVGVVLALMWMAPYVFIDSLRPDPEDAFDPEQLGASLVWLTLGLRLAGFALVTPFMEEIFVRSWLQRFSDVVDTRKDFRSIPIGRFTQRSFIVVVIAFVVTHVPWEWPVAFAWIVLTQLWFYHRKHITPLVIVHFASNFTIFLCVVLGNGKLTDSEGNPLLLWFFL